MNLTIVVPTYDRSALLKSCLAFIRKQSPAVEIVVADSSRQSEREINRKYVAALGAGIRYLEFDNVITPVEKVSLAIGHVATRYACMCADDDLIVVKSALKCVAFLESNPDYAACHGCYLRFSIEDSNTIVLEDWEYRGPSLVADSPAKRAMDLLSNYEALFYSVQATATLKAAIEIMGSSPFPMQQELANSLWLALSGKVKRLDDLYYFRRAEDPLKRRYGEPSEYLATRFPTIFSEYASMASAVMDKLRSSHKKVEDGLFEVLCFGFLVYLYRSISLFDVAKAMIPQYPHADLKELARVIPPTLSPTPGILARAFVDERIRFMHRGIRYLKRKMAQGTDQEKRVRDYSASTGPAIVVAQKLRNSLSEPVRNEIREIFARKVQQM